MSNEIDQITVAKCKEKLLRSREEAIEQIVNLKSQIRETQHKGDEIDQTNNQLDEMRILTQQTRLKKLLIDIDIALNKIISGSYGICEQTEESISSARLLALPWTRLSIEGAEVNDRLRKRFKHQSQS